MKFKLAAGIALIATAGSTLAGSSTFVYREWPFYEISAQGYYRRVNGSTPACAWYEIDWYSTVESFCGGLKNISCCLWDNDTPGHSVDESGSCTSHVSQAIWETGNVTTEPGNVTTAYDLTDGLSSLISIEAAKFDASGRPLNGSCDGVVVGSMPFPDNPLDDPKPLTDHFDYDKCIAMAQMMFKPSPNTSGHYLGNWFTKDCITMRVTPLYDGWSACEAVNVYS